jgi:hypothetical protein
MPVTLERARAWLGARFSGEVTPWPFVILRIGIGLLVLVRTSDLLRPIVDLDHHRWVRGLEYAPDTEQVVAPVLHSPLLPMPPLGDTLTTILVHARTVLAILLVTGIRPRVAAVLLGSVGYLLILADRFRYLHHLHLLWLTCLLLGITPCGDRWSLEHLFRKPTEGPTVPRWPLQVLRFHALVIYASAGFAKLRGDWLDGSTLASLERIHLVGGPLWSWLVDHLGRPTLAITTCAIELALVPLLAIPRTRIAGIVLGLAFHAFITETMMVSTFGATMALYLLLFAPWREKASSMSASSVSAGALPTSPAARHPPP